MNSRLKSLAIWGGRAVLLVALGFIAVQIRSHWTGLSSWRPDSTDAALLGALSLAYFASLMFVVEGWHRIVALYSAEPRSRTYPSFTMTQIAKYIPGNVAHLLGRGLYLRSSSLSDGQIVKATLVELAAIPAGAVTVIAVLGSAGLLSPLLPWLPSWLWVLLAPGLVLGVLAALVLAPRLGLVPQSSTSGLLVIGTLSTVFMALLGLIFAAVFSLLAAAPIAPLAGAAVIAWLVGYLTPGAPGGLGTREAALVALLWSLNQEDAVLIAAALFRIVTTLGDVLLFSVGWLVFSGGTARDEASSSH
ncbi:hypothetical protein ABVF61_06240 [Roseibium sp. HPY-6]|uniref:hypothetical protein n=1 Tax=Roseibium sp. HPY-6 TaxID=3229852 RepID=UPI00338D675F